jgi:predicted O-linked N-acetylglucosamine transferase (SPINDLY family)
MPTRNLQQAFDTAVAHHQAGRLPEADALYRQVLAAEPNHAGALRMLGVLAHQIGRNDVSAEVFRKLIAIAPNDADAHNNLGVALATQCRLNEAEAAYRTSLSLRPGYAMAHNNLGSVLRDLGRLDEAIASYQRAIELTPNYPLAYHNLGLAYTQKGDLKGSIAAYQQAVKQDPENVESLCSLGIAYNDAEDLDRAILCHRRAVRLRPDYFEAWVGLGRALKDAGEVEESIGSYRRALAIKPDARVAASLLFTLHYLPRIEPRELLEEHRQWNEIYARPLALHIRPHQNDRSPERRIRIGYVSADLSNHPVGRCLLPAIAHRDREKTEVYCYVGVAKPDEFTERFKQESDAWCATLGLSDEQLAEKIRKDRIDILVDLAVHTAGSRLLAMARKPAPVQSTWLGWPGTTGMDAIDYRLSDPYLDPPGENDEFYSEKTIRLPDSFWCYQPFDADVPVNDPPATQNRHITFLCLNNFWKVNDLLIELWARIMSRLPGSKLMIRTPMGGARQRLAGKFQRHGIEPSRIEFLPKTGQRQYWELYHRADITLDTTPYGGHTTAMDSIWMGVPVVSLAGRLPVGRAGVTILSNIGLPELVAQSPQEYVNIAVQLAGDLGRLCQLRSTLRDRLRASALMDAPRFARNLEAVYRQMWRSWCEPGGRT